MPRETKSPDAKELERIIEQINKRFGEDIQDKGTFDLAYNEFLDGEVEGARNTTMRERVFRTYVEKFPDTQKGNIFKRAGGKDFEKDQEKTAKRVLPNTRRGRAKYIKIGSKRADLKDYDTKKRR